MAQNTDKPDPRSLINRGLTPPPAVPQVAPPNAPPPRAVDPRPLLDRPLTLGQVLAAFEAVSKRSRGGVIRVSTEEIFHLIYVTLRDAAGAPDGAPSSPPTPTR